MKNYFSNKKLLGHELLPNLNPLKSRQIHVNDSARCKEEIGENISAHRKN